MNVAALFKLPTREKADKEFNFLKQVVAASVGALNTIAGREMYDALLLLRQTPIYRQRLKSEAEAAYREYCKFETYYRGLYDEEHYTFFLNYLDSVEDETTPAVKVFRDKVRAAMVKYEQDYPEMKACFITTRTLTDMACDFFDGLMSDSKERCCIDFSVHFKNVRLTGTRHRWSLACNHLFPRHDETIDLREDPDCLAAYNALEALLGDEDVLNRAGRKAILATPGIYNNLSDEDKKIVDYEKSN